MARYTEAVCRICRREGLKLFLKGNRCGTPKCAFERRSYSPGEHGSAQVRTKLSDYSLQLREKQKVKRIYGVLEKQFRNYYLKASQTKGVTGTILLQMLERRLDNVVYRSGFAPSRSAGRQMVRHGFIRVNGRRVDIPSYQIKEGDNLAVKADEKQFAMFREQTKIIAEQRQTPKWIEVNHDELKAKISAMPQRDDIQDIPVQEQIIVELYSK